MICGIASTFGEFFIWETRPEPQPASCLAERARQAPRQPDAPAPFSTIAANSPRSVGNCSASAHIPPISVRDAVHADAVNVWRKGRNDRIGYYELDINALFAFSTGERKVPVNTLTGRDAWGIAGGTNL